MSTTIPCFVIEAMPNGLTCAYTGALTEGKTLEGLQRHVDGYVECFDIHHPTTGAIATVWFNDEGKYAELERNDFAMALAITGGWEGPEYGDWIAGNAVLTGFNPETGETTAVPDEWLTLALMVIAAA